MLLSLTFTAKLELVFVLTFENVFCSQKEHRFFEKTIVGIGMFFMWQSVKVSKILNTLTLKQIFWETKIFFKKLEYCFLVETTNIKNTSFPYKTTLSEANVKTNRIATTKWTYHKEWSFAINYLIFLENLFQF